VPNSPGYIPTCVYEYDLFQNQNAYPGTDCPWGCRYYGRKIEYRKGLCPTAEEILSTAVRLTVSEFYTKQDLDETVAAVRKVAEHFHARRAK
jgi:dTDP-4-amino-4,6-dideoxygalactose transaminase